LAGALEPLPFSKGRGKKKGKRASSVKIKKVSILEGEENRDIENKEKGGKEH